MVKRCCQGVVSRGVVKGCGQGVVSGGVVRDIVECRNVVSGCLVIVLHVTVVYPWLFCVKAKTFKGSFQGECGPIQLFYECFWLTNTLSVDSTCR